MSNSSKRAIQVGSKWVDRIGVTFAVIGVTGAGFGEEEESVTTRAESGGVHTWYAFHSFLTWVSDPPGIPVTIGSTWIGSISGTEYEIDELKETCVIFKDKSRYCEGDTYELFRGPHPLYTPAPVKWVPRVGELALVTGIAEECCRDWAPVTSLIGQTLTVRDIRQQVSGKTGYDFAECPVLAHVTLAEPKKETKAGPAFLPKKGDKVRLLELQPGTSKRSSRHNVGDVFIASSSEQSAGVGPEDPAWAFIGDSDGRFFWGRVELVEAAKKETPLHPLPADGVEMIVTDTTNSGCTPSALKKGDRFTAGRSCRVRHSGDNPGWLHVHRNGDGGRSSWVKCEPAPTGSAARVDSAMAQLGPNARGLLADIADRLVIGKAHGDFEKPADWTKEAYEEDLDAIVYRTMRMRQAKAA